MDKNDLISRNALLKNGTRIVGNIRLPDGRTIRVEGISVPEIEYAPAVDPEEMWPKGKWIKHDDYTECSVCEYWYDSPEDETADYRPNYCPNCGAYMREDQG